MVYRDIFLQCRDIMIQKISYCGITTVQDQLIAWLGVMVCLLHLWLKIELKIMSIANLQEIINSCNAKYTSHLYH